MGRPSSERMSFMNFLKNIGKTVSDAAGYLGEKSRRAAYLNRIRTVIRCEEKAADREYLALGRYYYNSLRDKNNPVTEAHCAELEAIEGRLEKALDQLEQFYQAENDVTVIGGAEGFTVIDTAEGGAEEITLDDVESYDYDPVAEKPEQEAKAEADEAADLPFEG